MTATTQPDTPRVSPQRAADGIIASYIHEISTRHGAGEPPRPPAPAGAAASIVRGN